VYANDASVLCGNRLCGGSVGISEAACAVGGSGGSVSLFWPDVEVRVPALGARSVALALRQSRAQILSFVPASMPAWKV
jgi:hypothetical protein